MSTHEPSPLRAALEPTALRGALRLQRPVFGNPWDSPFDMFACYCAVSFIDPLLLWAGGGLMGKIFGFSSHWHLGVFLAACLVGAAGFMTIVGRQRSRLSVDVLTIGVWLVLGLIVAPIIGLAPPIGVAIALYAVLLVGVFVYVLVLGRFRVAFIRSIGWPVTWSLLALLFAYSAYTMIMYP